MESQLGSDEGQTILGEQTGRDFPPKPQQILTIVWLQKKKKVSSLPVWEGKKWDWDLLGTEKFKLSVLTSIKPPQKTLQLT